MTLANEAAAAQFQLTPFEWKDPASLPRRGSAWAAPDEFEEIDPKILEWTRQAFEARAVVMEEVAARHPTQSNLPQIQALNPAELDGAPVPSRKWFIEGLIPARQVTILSGDGGVGKSLLALQLAAAAAAGGEVAGLSPQACRAVYVGAEDDTDEFHRRLSDIASAAGTGLAAYDSLRVIPLADRDALLAVPDRSGTMAVTPLFNDLLEVFGEFGPQFIVLDTAADLFGGDEIKRAQVRQFIAMLRKVAIELDCAVLLLSHPSVSGMQSGSGSSGSTAWSNSVRSRLYMTKDEKTGIRTLKVKKSNYSESGQSVDLKWRDGVFVLDDGKPDAHAGILNRQADETFCRLLSMLNRQGRNVCHVSGTTYAPAIMAKLPEAKGIAKTTLADAMNRLLAAEVIKIVEEGPASRRRKRLILSSEDFGPKDDVSAG